MIFYGDDTEFISDRAAEKQDVFCIGGFGIKNFPTMRKIEELIDSVKTAYDILPDLSLKWNMKDNKVKRLYKQRNSENLWKQILSDFDNIRMDICVNYPN